MQQFYVAKIDTYCIIEVRIFPDNIWMEVAVNLENTIFEGDFLEV